MLTLKAPAKINWFLDVLGKRNDGYHNINSLMQWVDLHDSLVIDHSDTVEIVTEASISKQDNLVYKAAILLKDVAGVKEGVRIALRKDIPVAAGLGGGSSDAAFTLMGLNSFWSVNLNRAELAGIGQMLGSDIPFFFYGPASLIEGRGEIVSPVKLERSYVVALVKPPVDISTAWGYSELDAYGFSEKVLTKKTNDIKLFCQALDKGDFSKLKSMLRNDFEPVLVRKYPVIGDIKDSLMKKGALFSSMSGSGPTVFGVFASEQEAQEAVRDMKHCWSRVVKTVTRDG